MNTKTGYRFRLAQPNTVENVERRRRVRDGQIGIEPQSRCNPKGIIVDESYGRLIDFGTYRQRRLDPILFVATALRGQARLRSRLLAVLAAAQITASVVRCGTNGKRQTAPAGWQGQIETAKQG